MRIPGLSLAQPANERPIESLNITPSVIRQLRIERGGGSFRLRYCAARKEHRDHLGAQAGALPVGLQILRYHPVPDARGESLSPRGHELDLGLGAAACGGSGLPAECRMPPFVAQPLPFAQPISLGRAVRAADLAVAARTGYCPIERIWLAPWVRGIGPASVGST